MKALCAILLLTLLCPVWAQVGTSPSQILHPLTKQMPDTFPTMQNHPRPNPPAPSPQTAPASVKPVDIAPKIDAGLAASPISVMGKLDGLKGTMYVTNLSSQNVMPMARFAICDRNGAQIGLTSKNGAELQPNGVDKIEILTSNWNAGSFKLIKLSGGKK